MRKETTFLNTGRNSVTDFKADKKSYTMPNIVSRYIAKDGTKMLKLDNGRSIEEAKYNEVWMPSKTKIKGKNYKGDSLTAKQNKT